jgi:hypothetical protein
MGVEIGKSRTDTKPSMSAEAMESMSRANQLIAKRSERLGSPSKIKPVNNRILIGFSYPKSTIALPTASEAMRQDVTKRWIECVSDKVADDRPDLIPGSEIEIDVRRWVVEVNGLPCFIEDKPTMVNKYYVVSPE